MKLLSLFSGIGAFERALENLGITYELVNYCEIDKYASKSYSLLHNVLETKNLWDVTKVDTSTLPQNIDLLTYGFPCQDISLAGRQRGLEDNGERTRSGLVWDAHKIINDLKPKVAICENVKNLTGKKFSKEFKAILDNLESMGYTNYWKVLDSKDYGVPQHRERVFIVSVRKDIDQGYCFPQGFPLTKTLLDILESTVEPKYYLSEKVLAYFKRNMKAMKEKGYGFKYAPTDGNCIAKTITTKVGATRMDDNFIKVLGNYSPSNHEASRVLDPTGMSPTVKENHGTVNAVIIPSDPTSQIPKTPNASLRESLELPGLHPLNINPDGTSFTIKAQYAKTARANYLRKGTFGATGVYDYGNVRKLTPTECFRLMGFNKSDVEILRKNGISNTQLYKQAGNSIVVPVLEAIFKQLYKTEELNEEIKTKL